MDTKNNVTAHITESSSDDDDDNENGGFDDGDGNLDLDQRVKVV